MTQTPSRRDVLSGVAGAAALTSVGALAGCISDPDTGGDDGETENLVMATAGNKFDPEELTVSTGTTVTWEAETGNHNVCGYPEMNDKVSIPDDAEPFGSMEKGNPAEYIEKGGTFEYTFETPGEYKYVCIPHASLGMVGKIIVEE